MERTPGDLSGHGGALIPATGSLAAASTGSQPNAMAGTNPTPMTVDEGFFNQPVQAYFQFAQNNLTYINEGNIDAFRQEAEERHTHRSWNKRFSNCTKSLSKFALVKLHNNAQKLNVDMHT